MRRSVAAIVLVMLAVLGVAVPSASAAIDPSDPKVVIIVGATHGATPGYRSDADKAYAEAIKYTSNVVKVYSPYATWTKVKAATVGASVVIYLGHGNGWPSPYTYDPKYTTKDGFGLNATSGDGDYNNKYYGEPYVSTLDLAPGAIVILNHLCYASGNSEPGNPEPTVSVARQRADNYAAGFLKAGATAVIADGHAGSESYIRSLFTTHQTIEQMWRTMPFSAGHIVSFGSARTAGTTVYQDPNTPTSGFYRSLAVRVRGVTTDDVTGGPKPTDVDPTSLTIPGNAVVGTDGASLYPAADVTAAEPQPLPAGTRLRVVDQATGTTAEGQPLVEVEGIDDSSIHGFMAVGDLVPKDSTAPLVRSLSVDPAFSPNGDGAFDTAALSARFTESVSWTLTVRDGADTVLFQATGTGSWPQATWNGLVGGNPVPDGQYTVRVSGDDAWHNGVASATTSVTVDTTPSQLTGLTPDAETVQWFSPNADGYRDTIAVWATNSEIGSFIVRVRDEAGTVLKKWTVSNGSGPTAISWDGRDSTGHVVPDGTYIIRVSPTDRWGNAGASADRTLEVVGALRTVASSRTGFYPQDLDGLARTTTLSFTLARPMTVTWTLRNAAGQIVDTHLDAVALPAGTQSWVFTGRRTDGTMLPAGRYTSFVSATDGTLSATQSVSFDAMAFVIKPSDTTPARGQKISVYAITTETLSTAPRLYVYQPGKTVWSVPMVKSATNTYKAIITLKTGGSSGTVTFKVMAKDSLGGMNRTLKAFPLH